MKVKMFQWECKSTKKKQKKNERTEQILNTLRAKVNETILYQENESIIEHKERDNRNYVPVMCCAIIK